MKTVIFTVGLPSSGKTVWAKNKVARNEGLVKRVNKDDLRAMIDSSKYSVQNEQMINTVLDSIVVNYLNIDSVEAVIVDGCNLNHHIQNVSSYVMGASTKITSVNFIEKVFDVSPMQCVEWNKSRKGKLPENVIWDMLTRYHKEERFLEYNPKGDKGSGWIGFDLDGTLIKYDDWKGAEHFGDVIPKMMARLRQHRSEGDIVKIFTARAHDPKAIPHIRRWLIEQNLDDVEITNVKDFNMRILYDDRCVQVIPNTGELLRDKIKQYV